MAKDSKRTIKVDSTSTAAMTVGAAPRKVGVSRPTAPRPKAPVELNEQRIRERAFEIYLRRNGGPGDAASDWAQAERELRAELRR